jgi:hypothetical protein
MTTTQQEQKTIGALIQDNQDLDLDLSFVDEEPSPVPTPRAESPVNKRHESEGKTRTTKDKTLITTPEPTETTADPGSFLAGLPSTKGREKETVSNSSKGTTSISNLDQKAISIRPEKSPLSPIIERIRTPLKDIRDLDVEKLLEVLTSDNEYCIWNRDIINFCFKNVLMELLILKEQKLRHDEELLNICREGSTMIFDMICNITGKQVFYNKKVLFHHFAEAIDAEATQTPDKSVSNKFSKCDWINGKYPEEPPRCFLTGEKIEPKDNFYCYNCPEKSFLFKNLQCVVIAYAFKHVVCLPITIKQFIDMNKEEFENKSAIECIDLLTGKEDVRKGLFFNDFLAPYDEYAKVIRLFCLENEDQDDE